MWVKSHTKRCRPKLANGLGFAQICLAIRNAGNLEELEII